MVAQFVGIDVSRGRLDVHVYPSGVAFAVDRTEAARKLLTMLNAMLRDGQPWRTETEAHAQA